MGINPKFTIKTYPSTLINVELARRAICNGPRSKLQELSYLASIMGSMMRVVLPKDHLNCIPRASLERPSCSLVDLCQKLVVPHVQQGQLDEAYELVIVGSNRWGVKMEKLATFGESHVTFRFLM